MAVEAAATGVVVSCFLPRIRRSLCDTESAAKLRWRKGTVE
jgi:hypothetical protein